MKTDHRARKYTDISKAAYSAAVPEAPWHPCCAFCQDPCSPNKGCIGLLPDVSLLQLYFNLEISKLWTNACAVLYIQEVLLNALPHSASSKYPHTHVHNPIDGLVSFVTGVFSSGTFCSHTHLGKSWGKGLEGHSQPSNQEGQLSIQGWNAWLSLKVSIHLCWISKKT